MQAVVAINITNKQHFHPYPIPSTISILLSFGPEEKKEAYMWIDTTTAERVSGLTGSDK